MIASNDQGITPMERRGQGTVKLRIAATTGWEVRFIASSEYNKKSGVDVLANMQYEDFIKKTVVPQSGSGWVKNPALKFRDFWFYQAAFHQGGDPDQEIYKVKFAVYHAVDHKMKLYGCYYWETTLLAYDV